MCKWEMSDFISVFDWLCSAGKFLCKQQEKNFGLFTSIMCCGWRPLLRVFSLSLRMI
jgi:hypothetical protein